MFDYNEYATQHTVDNIVWALRGYDYPGRHTQIGEAVKKLEMLSRYPVRSDLFLQAQTIIHAWNNQDWKKLYSLTMY